MSSANSTTTFTNDFTLLQHISDKDNLRWFLEDYITRDVFSKERAVAIYDQLICYSSRLLAVLGKTEVVKQLRAQAKRIQGEHEKVTLIVSVEEPQQITLEGHPAGREPKLVRRPTLLWQLLDGCRDDPDFWWMTVTTTSSSTTCIAASRIPQLFPFKS